ncbi:DNA polymerase III subunit beta [Kaistia nematophila]|uniref:Beta sliding clamp n=1 Tax=Kaistia nematophila TaxID=2994654 RepID=A0A9X3E438_9HYPH|nr:DNA polymerase III subunit beta [Kaistia nematophila]MCX5571451.1 DNA polymerase III subunit beta [Kaistia nematophila]
MKLIVERAHLLAALTSCKAAVESRTTIPILSCVRLVASGSQVDITGTNIDIETTDRAAAHVERPGSLCVNQSELLDLIRRMPDGAEIALEQDGAKLIIRAGRIKASLLTLEANTFPVMDTGGWSHEFEIPIGDLVRMLRATEFAMNDEETRYFLCGVFLHAGQRDGAPYLGVAATDGHQLSWSRADLPEGAAGMRAVIVPRQTVSALIPLLAKRADKNATEPVAISINETKIAAAFGSCRIVSKQVDGTYPDYLRIIPSGQSTFAKLPRRQLELSSARAASILTGKRKAIRLTLNGEQEDGLMLTSASDAAEIEDHLNVILEGGPQTIAVNGLYLAASLGSFTGDDITLAIADPETPLLLSDDQDDRHGVVIMPMRA